MAASRPPLFGDPRTEGRFFAALAFTDRGIMRGAGPLTAASAQKPLTTVGLLVLAVACPLALALSAVPAGAVVRPFLYGQGQTVRTSTQSTDALLDPITITGSVSTWEGGIGLRLFPQNEPGARDERTFHWEFRFHYAWGGGKLPGDSFEAIHVSPRNPYSYTGKETYSESFKSLGVSFCTRFQPQLAAYIGPAIQSVTFKGSLTTSGKLPDPRFLAIPASGNDQQTTRYGLVHVGLEYNPWRRGPGLLLDWAPARFNLSTTHHVSASGWSGTYPDLKGSWGAGLIWEL